MDSGSKTRFSCFIGARNSPYYDAIWLRRVYAVCCFTTNTTTIHPAQMLRLYTRSTACSTLTLRTLPFCDPAGYFNTNYTLFLISFLVTTSRLCFLFKKKKKHEKLLKTISLRCLDFLPAPLRIFSLCANVLRE